METIFILISIFICNVSLLIMCRFILRDIRDIKKHILFHNIKVEYQPRFKNIYENCINCDYKLRQTKRKVYCYFEPKGIKISDLKEQMTCPMINLDK